MRLQGRRTPAPSTAQSRMRRATAGRLMEISSDETHSLGPAVPAVSHPHLTEALPAEAVRAAGTASRPPSAHNAAAAILDDPALSSAHARCGRHYTPRGRGPPAAIPAVTAARPPPSPPFFSRLAEAAGSRQSRATVWRSGGTAALSAGSAMSTPPRRRGAAVPWAILRRALFRALPARPAVPSASGRALPLPQRPAPRHGPQW